jgi:hypothetical protein
MNRRKFLSKGLLGGVVVGVSPIRGWAGSDDFSSLTPPKILNFNPAMKYRPMGNTGVLVSEISLGGLVMAESVHRYAIDHGVNLVHVGWDYLGGQAIKTLSTVLRSVRDKVYIGQQYTYLTRQIVNIGNQTEKESLSCPAIYWWPTSAKENLGGWFPANECWRRKTEPSEVPFIERIKVMHDPVNVKIPAIYVKCPQRSLFNLNRHREGIVGSQDHPIQLNVLPILRFAVWVQGFRDAIVDGETSQLCRGSPAIQKDAFQVGRLHLKKLADDLVHFRIVPNRDSNPSSFNAASSSDLEDHCNGRNDSEGSNYQRGDSIQPIKLPVRVIGGIVFLCLTFFFAWLSVDYVLTYDGIRGWVGFWGFALLGLLSIWSFFAMLAGTWDLSCVHDHQKRGESQQLTRKVAHKDLTGTNRLFYPMIIGRCLDARISVTSPTGVTKPSLSEVLIILTEKIEIVHESIAINKQPIVPDRLQIFVGKKDCRKPLLAQVQGIIWCYHYFVESPYRAVDGISGYLVERICLSDAKSYFSDHGGSPACIFENAYVGPFASSLPSKGVTHIRTATYHPSPFTHLQPISASLGGNGRNCNLIYLPRRLGDQCIRLSPGRAHLGELLIHALKLTLHCSQSQVSKISADSSGSDQQTGENDGKPFPPTCVYRHGDRFSDNYGFLCICVGWLLSGILTYFGFGRVYEHRRHGWLLFLGALLLNALATASGFIGCLPWNWGRCLTDGQDHGQNQTFHYCAHNYLKTKEIKYLTNHLI